MTLPSRDYLLSPTTDPLTSIFPLTHDELDTSGQIIMSPAISGAGHYCTPSGWSGNGVDSRLMCNTLPAGYANSAGTVSLTATITPGIKRSNRDFYVGLTNSSDAPKIELSTISDVSGGDQMQMALRCGSTTIAMSRPTWKFAFRLPELYGTTVPYNQALLFLDENTLLVACHFADMLTALYRCDLITGEWTGKAISVSTYQHIGSLAIDSTGQVWATDTLYHNIPLDLDASFSSGEITASSRGLWSTPDTPANGGITFVIVDGVEYVVRMGFSTGSDGKSTMCYVFRADQMNSTAMLVDRVKQFNLGTYIQDITWRHSDGLLYVSHGTSGGHVRSYDIINAIRNGVDGSTLTSIASYPAPSAWSEGVDFHPITDELWMSVEGLSTPGDVRQWSGSIWISPLNGVAQENRYLIDFLSTGEYQIRINERLFHQFTLNSPPSPNRFVIGGPPNVNPGWKVGYMMGGKIRNVAIKDRPFSQVELTSLASGGTGTLTTIPVTVINPGAESGVTGWIDEGSAITYARAANPTAASGSYYFAATGAVQLAHQRFDLSSILGISSAEIDSLTTNGKISVLVNWIQASYDGGSDPGGVGVRSVNSAGTIILTNKSSEIITDAYKFDSRSFSAQLAPGTQSFDVILHSTRTVGNNDDTYVDNISVVVVLQS